MIDITARSFLLFVIGGSYATYGLFSTPMGFSELNTGIIIVTISVVLQEVERWKQK